MKIKDMVVIALFAAVTAVLSQISIPLPFTAVPVTLQTLAVVLAGTILGSRRGALALVVYALMGTFGLPVFAQGKGGLPVLIGPTGGYIFGFIAAAYIIGKIVESNYRVTYLRTLAAMGIGLVFIYAAGVVQLKYVLALSFSKAISLGVAPFLPLELAKIPFGAYLGCAVRKGVLKAFPEFVS